jgi:hypothetical protein
MPPLTRHPGGPGRRRASVIVIVMVTLLFAMTMLLAFMDRAAVDLMADQRAAIARRLRVEAYSALEVALAVLVDFREAGGGLRSPAEGWNDPLGFAGHTPEEGRTVEIQLEDESGKLPLPQMNGQVLANLFMAWGTQKNEAEEIADAMMGWMKRGHTYTSPVRPDYESAPIPYEAPGRPLRSYHELAAIEKARDYFYDKEGRPNENWRRFTASVSLFDFAKPNLNSAGQDVLAALGRYDPAQSRSVVDFLQGKGDFRHSGPGFFQNAGDVGRITGPSGDPQGFATTISALRLNVTVREGRNEFRLTAVVAPPQGAKTVQAIATRPEKKGGSAAPSPAPPATGTPPSTGAAAKPADLKYPYTLLEIVENPPPAGG